MPFLPHPVKGHVVFDGVWFGYNPGDRMILQDINVDVAPGEWSHWWVPAVPANRL